jgi:hypothetical protein
MNVLSFVVALALGCLPVLCSQPAAAAEPALARVFVPHDAPDDVLLTIDSWIKSLGGTVMSYAPGDVFIVLVDSAQLPNLAKIHGVLKADLLPISLQSAAAPASTTGGAISPSPEETNLAGQVGTIGAVPTSSFAHRRSLVAAVSGPGASADNSLSPYFPPIAEQDGRSSCVAFAVCYYWNTYTQAADEDHDVSGKWLPRNPECDIVSPDPVTGKMVFDQAKFDWCQKNRPTIDPPRPSRAQEHIGSPAFLYPLINRGRDAGSTLLTGMSLINQTGCSSWAMKPYDPWNFASVTNDWPTEPQWLEALPRRTARTVQFDLRDPRHFTALKQLLWNGNIAVSEHTQFANFVAFMQDPTCQVRGECDGIDNDVLYAPGGSMGGGDAITIVGYDDDKAYTDQNGTRRQGAFLIATSGGPNWGTYNSVSSSRGFFWVAYDHVVAGHQWSGPDFWKVLFNVDRPKYRPLLYAAIRATGDKRMSFRAGVGFSRAPAYVTPPIGGSGANYNEARSLNPDERLIVDLSDGLDTHRFQWPSTPLFVHIQGSYGTLLEATEFLFDTYRTGSFESLPSPDARKVPNTRGVFACTNDVYTVDINRDGRVNSTDIAIITDALRNVAPISNRADCLNDPADVDRNGVVNIFDARKAVLQCTNPGCK